MMLGGLESQFSEEGSKFCFEINHETGIMRKKHAMNLGRFAFASANIRHYVVVVGGLERTLLNINGSEIPTGIRECQIYNTFTEKWYKLPPLPSEKIQPTLVTVNERFIFVIGGISRTNDIYCYDLKEFDEKAPERHYDANGIPYQIVQQEEHVQGHDNIDAEPLQINLQNPSFQMGQLDFECRNRWISLRFNQMNEQYREIYNIGDRSKKREMHGE